MLKKLEAIIINEGGEITGQYVDMNGDIQNMYSPRVGRAPDSLILMEKINEIIDYLNKEE